eukprot:8921452-Ditylum_brightwellii.AAC.1
MMRDDVDSVRSATSKHCEYQYSQGKGISRAKDYSSTYKDFVYETGGGSEYSTGQVSVNPNHKQVS